eukprot:TRINITY_DN2906_c0_g2_i3.p1 TRINITY_DN2906_c0_g2~~TRINITY_DN2906_c0_g2_i3.p1  ORF type:complete len:931 (-),score=368.23 TRINITY_DN2906_c0_g2_i3:64-2856(-)
MSASRHNPPLRRDRDDFEVTVDHQLSPPPEPSKKQKLTLEQKEHLQTYATDSFGGFSGCAPGRNGLDVALKSEQYWFSDEQAPPALVSVGGSSIDDSKVLAAINGEPSSSSNASAEQRRRQSAVELRRQQLALVRAAHDRDVRELSRLSSTAPGALLGVGCDDARFASASQCPAPQLFGAVAASAVAGALHRVPQEEAAHEADPSAAACAWAEPAAAAAAERVSQLDIAARAAHDADVLKRVSELQRQGMWGGRRVGKVAEPGRSKVHWDFVLAEMQWLANDFKEERKFKQALAKKVCKEVGKLHDKLRGADSRRAKDDEARLRRLAKNIAAEVKKFWGQIEKLVVFKQTRLAEMAKKSELNEHLSLLVDQTERFSGRVAANLIESPLMAAAPSAAQPAAEAIDKPAAAADRQQQRRSALAQLSQAPATAAADSPAAGAVCAVGGVGDLHDDDDDEFVVASDQEPSDDESTLDLEELQHRSQQAAGGSSLEGVPAAAGGIDETALLEREGALSLEQLLAAYGPDVPPPQPDSDSDADADSDAAVEDAPATSTTLSSEAYAAVDSDADGDSYDAADSDDDGDAAGSDDYDIDDADDDDDAEDEDDDDAEPTDGRRQYEAAAASDDADGTDQSRIERAANAARAAQPTGYTLETTKVKTKLPFLLRGPGPLREYQHIGLDWLVSMFDAKLNGILADEMGLGKTIMTISLLAHLACERQMWGPHLIVVPSSLLLNWEVELKTWCPAFKCVTYYGNPKERKQKRQGWSKPNAFHVCITSYKLILQDHAAFRRKQWQYLILDEAHNIKNFRSQRWQALLNFNAERRLLLTGTPLQNDVMELWSLMHFLMPHIFASHKEFKDWFANPLTSMIEADQAINGDLVQRLHSILRPFLLRRMKSQVEKQLPQKHDHVLLCRLSKRQRLLYEEFMASADTK